MDLKNDFIGQIVAEDFRTAVIFERNGIDFCCGGNKTIETSCKEKEKDPQIIYEAIESLSENGGKNIDFRNWPLDLLADYVQKIHHRYAYEKIPMLQSFLQKLCDVHGERHPELFQVRELFEASVVALEEHFFKEEQVLFPLIRSMVEAKLAGMSLPQSHCGTVGNPIAVMMNDHDNEGRRFELISKLTSDYTPPSDGCETYRAVYAFLKEFEDDLHTHIHIENNILFPGAIKLEEEFPSTKLNTN